VLRENYKEDKFIDAEYNFRHYIRQWDGSAVLDYLPVWTVKPLPVNQQSSILYFKILLGQG